MVEKMSFSIDREERNNDRLLEGGEITLTSLLSILEKRYKRTKMEKTVNFQSMKPSFDWRMAVTSLVLFTYFLLFRNNKLQRQINKTKQNV
jgi:hypothetical protein